MQENEKRIVVKKTARRAFRTEAIWQYDVGHVLAFEGFDELPETFQVHFSRSMMGEAVTMIGSGGECAVPDMYAQTAAPIYAWLYIAEDDTGLTTYLVEIPVQRRAQITDQEPTPVEQSAFDQAIAALNDGVTRAEAAQAAAEGAQAGAEGYAETAADSAITAGNAARAAAASETAAAGSASAAAGSAQDALASREGADQSASAAGVSERAAKASETAAAGSASAAAGSASAAAGSASQAAGYASTAADNARAAAGSATAADTSARAAAGSAADSQQSAQAAVAIAQGAAASAAAADGSATEAAGSASAAAGSASAAAGSATAAAGSASQAAQTAAGIETAGAAQVAAIEAKGAQVIWSIPADYSELSGDVNSLKSAFTEHEQYAEETYAKKDGYYSEMTVGNAEQLVSSKFVEDQEPYTLRASGGSADIGNRENLTAIIGGTLAWNQQVRDEASDNETEFADIVTVDDAVADNAAVKVKLEPVQDLHGYDSPWPAGGGKNKFALPDGTVVKNGMTLKWQNGVFTIYAPNTTSGEVGAGDSAWKGFGYCTLNAGSYTFYTARPTVAGSLSTYLINYDTGDRIVSDKNTGTFTFTLASETKVYLGFYMLGAQCATESEWKVGVFLTSEYTGYAPYSNICPISGWDAVKVTRTGRNLLNKAAGVQYAVPRFIKFGVNQYEDTVPNKTIKLSAGTYTFSVSGANSTNYESFAIFDESNTRVVISYNAKGITFTLTKTGFYYIGIVIQTDLFTSWDNYDLMLESGSTATAYEPYQGQTYSITIPSEAGTVYGGELTVNEDGTGTLVVDRVIDTITKDSAWYSFTTGTGNSSAVVQLAHYDNAKYVEGASNYNGAISSIGEEQPNYWVNPRQNETTSDCGFAYSSTGQLRVHRSDVSTITDLATFKAAFPDMQICYMLATPITHTLTASQVQTLLGTNNVWSDAGQVSLTYTGTDEHLTLTNVRKYLTRINGVDSMVLGAGQAVTAVKGRDNVFDLTQMFGTAAVADYVYGQGTGYFRKWFPNSVYAYNPGELKSVEGLQSHDTVGFNLFDKSNVTHGHFINGNDVSAAVAYFAHSDYLRVVGGQTYYYSEPWYTGVNCIILYDANKTMINRMANRTHLFALPDNCVYVRLNMHDDTVDSVVFNLVNSGSRNGEYEPYEKHSYSLDSTLTLRGIPKAGSNGIYWDGDQYKPDGTVERRYGVVDLGSLTWTYDSTYNRFNSVIAPAKTAGNARAEPIACAKYMPIYDRRSIANVPDKAIYRGTDHDLSVHDSAYTDAAAFKSAMSGVYLVYELATPTAETAEPYKELQQVDDWGTEEFVTTGLIPVGHTTQYTANLRDKLQHLPDLASSNGIYIVKQTDSEMELMRLPDIPTTNGNYRLKLNVASGSPTFSWEVVT